MLKLLLVSIKIHTFSVHIVSKHQSLHEFESEWRPNVFWPPLVARERIFGLGTQGNMRVLVSSGIWFRPTADADGEEMASNLKGDLQ